MMGKKKAVRLKNGGMGAKKKAVKKVPKVQKSGRGNSKEDVAVEAIKKKRARLQKSGKQDDAASVFYDML